MAQERTSISLEAELLKRLRRLAKQEGLPFSTLVGQLCLRAIGDYELAAKARKDPLTERLIQEMLRPENIERAARIVGQESENPRLFNAAAALGRLVSGHVKGARKP